MPEMHVAVGHSLCEFTTITHSVPPAHLFALFAV